MIILKVEGFSRVFHEIRVFLGILACLLVRFYSLGYFQDD